MVKVFLAGIIQGSIAEKRTHDQDYRTRLTTALEQALPGVNIFDPVSHHPNSIEYPSGQSRDVFFELMQLAGECDVLVAFLPEASMGTAVELWRAHENGSLVLTISPMAVNWAVRFLSDRLYATLEEFEAAAGQGELARLVEQHVESRVCQTPAESRARPQEENVWRS